MDNYQEPDLIKQLNIANTYTGHHAVLWLFGSSFKSQIESKS